MRELTLCLLKPSLVKNPCAVRYVQYMMLSENFQIVSEKKITWSISEASQFYKCHNEEFYFNRLISFMCSGPIIAQILARENAVSKWREIMGPSKVYKTVYSHPNSIRAICGLSDTRNAVHGSDTPESAASEINYLFPDFNIIDWYENEMKDHRNLLKSIST